jgi:formylglycine-generating enzyme required for sulfatase activity
MIGKSVFAVLACVPLVAGCVSVRSRKTKEAVQAFNNGVSLENQCRYGDAISRYKAARKKYWKYEEARQAIRELQEEVRALEAQRLSCQLLYYPPVFLRGLKGNQQFEMLKARLLSIAESNPEAFTMVKIPMGKFTMGQDNAAGADSDKKPAHEVSTDEYYIDRRPFTNIEYAVFLAWVKSTKDRSFRHPDEPKGHSYSLPVGGGERSAFGGRRIQSRGWCRLV